MNENQKSGLAVACLVLGIIGLALSLIPIINNAAFIFALIGLVLGIIGLIKKNKKGLAIAGIILCVLAMAVTLIMQKATSDAFQKVSDDTSNKLSDMSGDNTSEILGKDVSVDLGDFTLTEDSYGFIKSSLPVTVKNLTSESKTFNIQLEAVDASGNRIDDDYMLVNDLGAGQTQSFEKFTLVTSDHKEAMKTATFKIVKVSMY